MQIFIVVSNRLLLLFVGALPMLSVFGGLRTFPWALVGGLRLRSSLRQMIIAATVIGVAGCGSAARQSVADGTGPQPLIPKPSTSLIPTVNVVTAKGWAAGQKPIAAEGTVVTAFATGLDHPRWLCVLPNGDVLVAETNAPVRPEDAKGIKGWFFKYFQKKAGGNVPSANRITLLRDVARPVRTRHVSGPARLLESQAAQRLQSHFRAEGLLKMRNALLFFEER